MSAEPTAYSVACQLEDLCRAGDLAGAKSLKLDESISMENPNTDCEIINSAGAVFANGRTDIAYWLLGRFPGLERHLTREAWRTLGSCAGGTGDPLMAEWLVERFRITNSTCKIGPILTAACGKGNMRFIRWLCEKFRVTADDARYSMKYVCKTPLIQAVSNGHLEVANWLVHSFGLGIEDARMHECAALRYATEKGHLDAVMWLFETIRMDRNDARSIINVPSERWNPAVVAWLQARFPKKANVREKQ